MNFLYSHLFPGQFAIDYLRSQLYRNMEYVSDSHFLMVIISVRYLHDLYHLLVSKNIVVSHDIYYNTAHNGKSMKNTHTFHIPIMGIGFTVDSALKVARYGINSVMSLSGQRLHEKLRKFHSGQHGIAYEEITEKVDDYRAKRTTAYLNLLNALVSKTFEEYKSFPKQYKAEIEQHINMLPDNTKLKKEFHDLMEGYSNSDNAANWVESNLQLGSIDVNIMTKLDRENYLKGEKLPPEHNDGHTALRGYALSELSSSLVLSAGLNPRLFTYMEQFDDFYPDANGKIKKKIILKVSDYRSALIQGKFLAKKGLWVSEYRIESGLNCGGHAFATEGFLMGPILAEFKANRNKLFDEVFELLRIAFENKNRSVSREWLSLKLSAQGGVGTSEEHRFLLEEYQLDSIGWGSPFLLVPEATNVDSPTLTQLIEAEESDFFLSNISPLGVPFNSLRGTTKEKERQERVAKGKPGSPCIEGSLALFNKEFTDKPICTASRQYQNLKIEELIKAELDPEIHQKRYDEIVAKTCLCTGLVTSVLEVNDLNTFKGNDGASICPGPNMVYFKKVMTLKEITDNIYGRKNIDFTIYRPIMFVKEIYVYIDFLSNLLEESRESITKKEQNRLIKFSDNLMRGIDYYNTLFTENKNAFAATKSVILSELDASNKMVGALKVEIVKLAVTT